MADSSRSTGASALARLSFHSTQFDIVDRDGQPWLKASEIAQALGYADESAINRIYARRATEFTECMSCSVNLTDRLGRAQEVRIFSLRGAHLIGMFARTERAAEFRRWVLDVLERGQGAEPARPASDVAAVGLPAPQEPQRVALAFAMATEVSAQVQRAVFDALMASDTGSDDWRLGRWMFLFGDDPVRPDGPGRPLARPIDRRAFVMTLERLTEALRNGDASASDKELADLASACAQRLALRLGQGRAQ